GRHPRGAAGHHRKRVGAPVRSDRRRASFETRAPPAPQDEECLLCHLPFSLILRRRAAPSRRTHNAHAASKPCLTSALSSPPKASPSSARRGTSTPCAD